MARSELSIDWNAARPATASNDNIPGLDSEEICYQVLWRQPSLVQFHIWQVESSRVMMSLALMRFTPEFAVLGRKILVVTVISIVVICLQGIVLWLFD